MNQREAMLKKLSACQFTLWEMHLYLDTHPWDLQMVEAHGRATARYKTLRTEYEEQFGALTASKAQGFEWLKGPWPWENEECGC
ncbi:MAG: spore coat protein CotJB [Acutalibacteraceae bacterium]|nr:spore coat protein CotJB [Acutalibacteraceae bacterium]